MSVWIWLRSPRDFDSAKAAVGTREAVLGQPVRLKGATMNRHVAAFLLAPLTVPLLISVLALQILREVPSLYWLGLMMAAAVSYAGAVLAGAPVYAALRSGGWTALWI